MILASFGIVGSWLGQPLEVSSHQLRTTVQLDGIQAAEFVAELARTKTVFELEIRNEITERYIHHPALGIVRNELDEIGEVLIRASQLEALMLETGGNLSDFARGFRRLSAVPWLDLVEPYRKSAEYLAALPRAV